MYLNYDFGKDGYSYEPTSEEVFEKVVYLVASNYKIPKETARQIVRDFNLDDGYDEDELREAFLDEARDSYDEYMTDKLEGGYGF